MESDCQNKLLRNPDTPFLEKLNSEFVLKESVSYTGIMPVRCYLYIKPDLFVKTMFQHTPPKDCNRGTLLEGGVGGVCGGENVNPLVSQKLLWQPLSSTPSPNSFHLIIREQKWKTNPPTTVESKMFAPKHNTNPGLKKVKTAFNRGGNYPTKLVEQENLQIPGSCFWGSKGELPIHRVRNAEAESVTR